MLVVSVDGALVVDFDEVHSKKTSGHIYLWKIINNMQFLSYDMCSSILLLNFLVRSK